jgi:hypothetical protein
MPVMLICQYEPCSKPFPVPAYRKETARFCSRVCKQASMILLPNERKTCTLICRSCGNPFTVEEHKKDKAHYCSQECHYASKRKPVDPVICAYCGTSFIVQAHRMPTARFCSTSCHNNWRAETNLTQFWDKVQICSHGAECVYCCWPWQGSTVNIYGKTNVNRRHMSAHRRAWELGNNKPFPEDLFAAHWCHQKSCCNFMHCRPATQQENIEDNVRDKRVLFGESHGNSKLTEETAIEAFRLKNLNWSNLEIAQQLHVSKSTIRNLMAGDIWKHLQRPELLPRLKPGPRPKNHRK